MFLFSYSLFESPYKWKLCPSSWKYENKSCDSISWIIILFYFFLQLYVFFSYLLCMDLSGSGMFYSIGYIHCQLIFFFIMSQYEYIIIKRFNLCSTNCVTEKCTSKYTRKISPPLSGLVFAMNLCAYHF